MLIKHQNLNFYESPQLFVVQFKRYFKSAPVSRACLCHLLSSLFHLLFNNLNQNIVTCINFDLISSSHFSLMLICLENLSEY